MTPILDRIPLKRVVEPDGVKFLSAVSPDHRAIGVEHELEDAISAVISPMVEYELADAVEAATEPLDDKIENLKDDVSSLESKLETIKDERDELKDELNDAVEKISRLERELEDAT